MPLVDLYDIFCFSRRKAFSINFNATLNFKWETEVSVSNTGWTQQTQFTTRSYFDRAVYVLKCARSAEPPNNRSFYKNGLIVLRVQLLFRNLGRVCFCFSDGTLLPADQYVSWFGRRGACFARSAPICTELFENFIGWKWEIVFCLSGSGKSSFLSPISVIDTKTNLILPRALNNWNVIQIL